MDTKALTISGTWDPKGFEDLSAQLVGLGAEGESLWQQLTPEREVVLRLGARRLFGVEWWARAHRFRAVMEGDLVTDPALDERTLEATFTIVSPVIVERAAWWRRAGYAVVRRLPGG